MPVSTPVFVDGFGRRVVQAADGGYTELLQLDPVLTAHDRFKAALTDRVAQLHGRRLTAYARVQRLDADSQGVTVASEHVTAWRLADILDVAESENLTFDVGVVMLLLRQLLPTAALLSTQVRDAASGALGPEHLLLTPQGRLVLTDYVFGPAIDALQWSPEQLWRTLRVAVSAGAAGRAVSQRGDVVQVGITVLSLVAGRRLRDDEFPDRLEVLVESARQKTPTVVDAPLAAGLRDWLLRALQRGEKNFATLFEAQMALERLLTTDTSLLAQPVELDQAVTRFARFMPPFELPAPEDTPLMEAPPPDLVPMAVAFDGPATPATRAASPTRKSGVRRKAATVSVEPMTTAIEPSPDLAESADHVPHVIEPVPVTTAVGGDRRGNAPNDPVVAEAPSSTPTPTPLAAAPAPAVVDPPVVVPMRSPVRAVDEPPLPQADAQPRFDVAEPAPTPWWRSGRAVAALFAIAALQAGVIGWLVTRPSESLGGEGELVVHSRPEGATVVIDDRDHGVTPLTVRIRPGTHVLQVRAGSAEPRVIPLSIRAGTQTAQYVELQGVSTTGVLEVRSEPGRARVSIDGKEHGSTPLTLRDVSPGEYRVVVERGGVRSTQVVRVEPGTTAQLVVPLR